MKKTFYWYNTSASREGRWDAYVLYLAISVIEPLLKNHLSYMIKAVMKKKFSHFVMMSVSLLLQTVIYFCKVARSKAVTLLGVLPFFFFKSSFFSFTCFEIEFEGV